MERNDITVSSRAAAHIANALSHEPPGSMLRISIIGGGCSGFQYNFSFEGKAAEDDCLLSHQGAKILIDPVSLTYLKGSEIDFIEDLTGCSLFIKNPNISSMCGCGVSFSI